MNFKYLKIITICFLALLIKSKTANGQSLSGTTWDITIPALSQKPYNFIFSAAGRNGNVLMPDGKLADFTWAEDGKGYWSIQIEQIIDGSKKIETFKGKISSKKGSGFYTSSTDRSKMLPLTMIKK